MLFEFLNLQRKEDIIYCLLCLVVVQYIINRPKLSLVLKKRLNCDITRIIFLSYIVYQTNYNYKLSIIFTALYLTLYILMTNEEIEESYKNTEKFINF